MKSLIMIIVLLFAANIQMLSDIYFKEEIRLETPIDDDNTETKIIGTSETWIGNNIIKYVELNRLLIIDLTKMSLIYANTKNKTYVETSLPIDLKSFLGSDLMKVREKMLTSGFAIKTSDKAIVCGKECRMYQIAYCNGNHSDISSLVNINLWATTDIPIPIDPYYVAVSFLRLLYNRDAKLSDDMAKIKGIQMKIEAVFIEDGIRKKNIAEVKEISEKQAPAGIYTLPRII
ncbi:MAG: hypothetical protein QG635_2358, partial [Bacteroidota bacterium]|nr:hypothetical protein [Bacteroidota bacterium]